MTHDTSPESHQVRTGRDLSTPITRGILALWAREGKWAEISVSGFSMTPLLPDRSRLTVRFGRHGLAVGDVVLYSAPEHIVAHRVLRLGRGGRRWGYLKVKGDPLRHSAATWIPVEDVIGRVVAARRPDGTAILLNGASGRIASRVAAVVSVAGAALEGRARTLLGAGRDLTITPALLGLLDPLYRHSGSGRFPGLLLDPEERLLITAARVRMTEEEERRLRQLLRKEVPWERIVAAASGLGLGPLLYRNLSRGRIRERVPGAALASLAKSAHAAACRFAIQMDSLRAILAVLRRDGIDPVLLKGAALALTLYDQPALRPMQDIDLLVEEGEVERAVSGLEAIGFRGITSERSDAFYATHHHARPMIRAGGQVIVEIHRGLVPPEDGLRLDPGPFIERAVRVERHGERFRTLSREDQILHLGLHLSYADRFIGRLRDLLDLHATIDHEGRPLEWGRILTCSRRHEVSRSLYSTFDLARRLLGTPVPAAVLGELTRGAGWDPFAAGLLRTLARSSLFRASSSEAILSTPAARWLCDALIKRLRWGERLRDALGLLSGAAQIAV